jgi:glycosyltransferase involved in cell wall biosynthesis
MTTKGNPLLSVVIPVYNGMPYLRDTVESVLPQLTPDMELIVRNNGSSDGTAAYLESLSDSRIRVIHCTETVSAGENWSAVCRLATGSFTKVLCADDTVLPGGLDRQLKAAFEHPDAALVASRRRVIDETGRVIIRRHGLPGLTGTRNGAAATKDAIMKGNNPFGEPSSTLFRTDALLLELPFTEEFPYLTDLDMYVKVLRHGSFVGLDTVDATFRLSSTSWSSSIGASQLGQFRAWVAKLLEHGELSLTRQERALLRVRVTAMFAARRVATLLTPALAVLRR